MLAAAWPPVPTEIGNSIMRDYGSGSITRSGKSWRVQVELPRDPLTGSRRRNRFTVRGTKREAQRKLREALNERDHGIHITPDRVTLGEYLPRWIEGHAARRGLKPSTVLRYRGIIRQHVLPILGTVRLRELRPDHIFQLLADSDLSPSTLHQHHVVINRALQDAVKAGLIAANPCARVDAPTPGTSAEARVLDDDEIRALLAAVDGTAFAMPVRFALFTGVRQGELLALRWADIDLDQATVTIRRTARYFPGKGIQTSDTKTAKSRRTIELSRPAVQLLRRHRQAQRENRLRAGATWEESELVFPSARGTPWFAHNFYRDYKKAVRRADLTDDEGVNFHTLRHTAATQWIRSGADIHIVSRRMGHASASFTSNTYGHLLTGMQRTAAEALDHLLA